MRLYLDANALIQWVEGEHESSDLLEQAVLAYIDNNEGVVTSDISLAEVLVPSLRPDANQEDQSHGATFQRILGEDSAIATKPITRAILLAAAEMRAHLGPSLRLPDAIHLATAKAAACTHVISGDRKLRPSALFDFERVGNTESDLRALLEQARRAGRSAT